VRAVYPGTFNPPTVGHTAICAAAITANRLTALDLVISHSPLAKSVIDAPSLSERIEIIEASVAHLEIVRVEVTDLRLIADIAAGYDVVIMGADKWHQVNDSAFYESEAHRDEAVQRLPLLSIATRGDDPVPTALRLPVPAHIDKISSSGARAGAIEWMTPEAAASGLWLAAPN
jgi:nicotinamide mononucleotide adenylyltransferase